MPLGIPFLVVRPRWRRGGGDMPVVRAGLCTYCGGCVSLCPAGALNLAETRLLIDEVLCTECGLCISGCPTGALAERELPGTFQSRQRSCDIVVVGGGPAGATAARFAAEAGLRVLLVEKRQEIGSPVRCAEGINTEMLLRFAEPEQSWIASRVQRSQIATVDAGEAKTFGGQETGYVLERRVFDRALVEKAIAAGATVMLKTAIESLIIDDGAVRGVCASDGRARFEVQARVVIAADGVESRLGEWAGVDCLLRPSDCLVCAQYLLAGIDLDPECCYYYLGEDLAPGGYAWVFPKGSNKANVGLGVQADLGQAPALDYLLRFIEQHAWLAQGSPVSLITGNVPVGIPHYPIVRDGLMLVGDAARQADPLTGGGIANAMLAGQLAAQAAAHALEQGDTSETLLGEYERRWREGRGRQMERHYRLKEHFSAADRCSTSFVRAFAVATVGK
ncbi:MAG TPA: geranylgeranyl reductase family protein [Anaerolineae bacterium]|nr:geranylgeranyl reductase family protein [Anaerolineae bacterium]